MITIEQLKELQQRADKLKQYLAIDEKRVQLEEEELRTQDPGFWEDAKAAEAQMRKVRGIKKWIEGYEGVARIESEEGYRQQSNDYVPGYQYFGADTDTCQHYDVSLANGSSTTYRHLYTYAAHNCLFDHCRCDNRQHIATH